jgi:hypothetical protein
MLPIQNIYDGSILRDIDDKALKLLYFIIKTLSFPKNAFIIDLTGGSYLYNLLGKTHYPSLNDFREDIVRNMINYGLSETEARELLLLIESLELNLKYLLKDPTTNEYVIYDQVNAVTQSDALPFYEVRIRINGVDYIAQVVI